MFWVWFEKWRLSRYYGIYTDEPQDADIIGVLNGARASLVHQTQHFWLQKARSFVKDTVDDYISESGVIYKGFETFLAHPILQGAPRFHLCLENLSVAHNTGLVTQSSSETVFK